MSEQQIEHWRGYLRRHGALTDDDIAALEEQLRGQITSLLAAGLSEEEAFLVGIKRMASVNEQSRALADQHSEELWSESVPAPAAPDEAPARSREIWIVIALAVGAALSIRAGMWLLHPPELTRVASALVLPWLAGYFAWKRSVPPRTTVGVAVGFAAVLALLLAYPLNEVGSETAFLTVIHAPPLLWLLTGVLFAGGEWRSGPRRLEFIRFTGEWAVYYFLIAAGGGLLLALAGGAFNAVQIDAQPFLSGWVLPCGAAGATLVAAWLVESRRNVIGNLENMAPELARVFSPLTVLLLLALLVAFALHPSVIDADRNLLILMTVILVLVLGLWVYALSAANPQGPAVLTDWLSVALVVTAIVVDLVVLVAMAGRIAGLGMTPNRVAALGLNVVLLVNLVVSARLGWSFLRGRRPMAALRDWQVRFLPVYAVWTALVVVAWGPLFHWT